MRIKCNELKIWCQKYLYINPIPQLLEAFDNIDCLKIHPDLVG